MTPTEWSDPLQALSAVTRLLATAPEDILARLASALDGTIAIKAMVALTGGCARSPLRTYGANDLTGQVTTSEVFRLAKMAEVDRPVFTSATLAGRLRPVLVVSAATAATTTPAVLAIATAEDPSEWDQQLVAQLWQTITVHFSEIAVQVVPPTLKQAQVGAGERARIIGELTEICGAALRTMLGALRSRNLDDASARMTATDVAAAALVELGTAAQMNQDISEEPASDAFRRIETTLHRITSERAVDLEIVKPRSAQRTIPSATAHAARAIARSAVLMSVEELSVSRIRVEWQITDDDLEVSVRDDGSGHLDQAALAMSRADERARSVGGSLSVDSASGWGTVTRARLPLARVENAEPIADRLSGLNPREIEVLQQLMVGMRNRGIAEKLGIKENTVKFHVGNILDKLGVESRGEAAALARGM